MGIFINIILEIWYQKIFNYASQEKEETSTPHKTCWECRVDERSTGKKNTTIEWDDGGKIGNKNKLILTEIFPSVRETWYLKVFSVNVLSGVRNKIN